MREIKVFSLEEHAGASSKWPRKTRLFYQNSYTGSNISGYKIEHQFKCNDCYLLITGTHSPYDRSNYFTMLDKNFQPIAYKKLEANYHSLEIESYRYLGNNTFKFKYSNGYYLRVLMQPQPSQEEQQLALEVSYNWP